MNIKNSIIIRHNHEERYYSCIVGFCHNDSFEIDIVSRDEFSKRGWLMTDNLIYCSDRGLEVICPECVKSENL